MPVYVVDDDLPLLAALGGLLRSAAFEAVLLSSAQEFLEQTGYQVQEVPGLLVRLTREGQSEEMTREKAVLLAMRRLAAQGTPPQ